MAVLGPEWEFAGEVGVDSAQLLITDPSYISSEWIDDTPAIEPMIVVLTDTGRAQFPDLPHEWTWSFGTLRTAAGLPLSFADPHPDLGGISVNEAFEAGYTALAEDAQPVNRTLSLGGAYSVARRSGEGFGQLNYRLGHAGAGVAVSTGYGDGVYPVYVRRTNDGRVAELRVLFIDDDG